MNENIELWIIALSGVLSLAYFFFYIQKALFKKNKSMKTTNLTKQNENCEVQLSCNGCDLISNCKVKTVNSVQGQTNE